MGSRFQRVEKVFSPRCSGYEFAVNLRKIGLYFRDDVGIVPYIQISMFSVKIGQYVS